MEHKIIILTGKSGSGKSLVARKLQKNGFKPIITNTTRPPREGEKDGVNYYYLSNMEFKNRIANGEMIEYHKYNTEFGVWYYGSSANNIDLNKHDYVAVLTLEGAEAYVNYFGAENCIIFYIDAPKSIREKRAKERDINFNQAEWDRRVKTDNADFSQDKVAHICNFRVDNYNKTIYNLIKEIKEDIRLWKNG
jgi:guanylate kinase